MEYHLGEGIEYFKDQARRRTLFYFLFFFIPTFYLFYRVMGSNTPGNAEERETTDGRLGIFGDLYDNGSKFSAPIDGKTIKTRFSDVLVFHFLSYYSFTYCPGNRRV